MRSAEVYVDQSQLTTLLNSITNFTPPTPLPLPLKGAESTRFVSCLRRFTDSIFRMDGLLMNSQLCSICSRSCHRRPNLFSSSNYSPSRLQLERISYNYRVSVTMRHGSSFNSAAPSTGALQQDSLGRLDNTLPTKDILDLWGNANAVCFDVDSTVCLDEGIDELAEFCGAGQAVADWTARAMSGTVRFEEALAARLSLFKPSLAQVQEFLEKRPPRISPGIETLVQKLKAKGTEVYLISGGFRQMINPVASILGIPSENIFANQLLFGDSGEFAGFDTNEPTSRSGGKATAVRDIRKSHGYKSLVMIGDGATDLEARQPGGADMFICYGGVQLREAVAAKADWVVFNFRDLINSLE